jgi:cytochrome c
MMWRVMAMAAATIVAAGTARADGDAERGAKRFEECKSCHTLDRAQTQNTLGPSLYGVFERKAGTLADYRYSPAMKRSGIAWTPEAIDKFLSDPQAAVPANRMPYAGLTDASARADLIAFLVKTFK